MRQRRKLLPLLACVLWLTPLWADEPPPGYTTIQNNATALTKRRIVNFKAGCVDNASSGRTDCTFAAPPSGGVFTAGSVPFGDGTASLAQNNANFFWDNTNNRLGIGTTAPSKALHVVKDIRVSGTGPNLTLAPTGGDEWHLGAESGGAGGVAFFSNTTDAKHIWEVDGLDTLYFPQLASCGTLGTGANGAVLCQAAGSGTVTSISQGTGMSFSVNPLTTTGTINLATPVTVANGGTGQASWTANSVLYASNATTLASLGAATNGQLLIGSTAAAPVLAALTGTANQITVTNGAGSITLATPQNLHTAATPTFSSLTLSGLTANSFLYSGAAGALTTTAAPTNGQLLIGSTGAAPVAATVTGTASQITVTNGAGSITLATPQNLATSSSPTFAAMALTGTGPNLTFNPTGGDSWHLGAESGPSGGVWFLSNTTDAKHVMEADGNESILFPQLAKGFLYIVDGRGTMSSRGVDSHYSFFAASTLSTTMNAEEARIWIKETCTLQRVELACTTAPAGSAIIVDVNQCTDPTTCTTLFSVQSNRPQIAAGAFSGNTTTFNTTTLTKGQYLGFDIDQVGSGTAGSNLTVTVVCRVS